MAASVVGHRSRLNVAAPRLWNWDRAAPPACLIGPT